MTEKASGREQEKEIKEVREKASIGELKEGNEEKGGNKWER